MKAALLLKASEAPRPMRPVETILPQEQATGAKERKTDLKSLLSAIMIEKKVSGEAG